MCSRLRVHQRQLPDLLQQGVQVGSFALPELSLLFGEFGPLSRLLLLGLQVRLLGQTDHFLDQLAAALRGRLLGLCAAVRLVADDLEVEAVAVERRRVDRNTNLWSLAVSKVVGSEQIISSSFCDSL